MLIANRVLSLYGEVNESSYEAGKYFLGGNEIGEQLVDMQRDVFAFVADQDASGRSRERAVATGYALRGIVFEATFVKDKDESRVSPTAGRRFWSRKPSFFLTSASRLLRWDQITTAPSRDPCRMLSLKPGARARRNPTRFGSLIPLLW